MFLMLWLFFILLNGKITLEIVLLGLGIALLVLAFCCAFMARLISSRIRPTALVAVRPP